MQTFHLYPIFFVTRVEYLQFRNKARLQMHLQLSTLV